MTNIPAVTVPVWCSDRRESNAVCQIKPALAKNTLSGDNAPA